MLKLFLFLVLLLQQLLSGKNFLEDEYLQIIGNNLEIKDNIIEANGDVVVYSQNYYITANRLIYNKNNLILELFDDVNMIKNNEILSFSDYSYIDIKNEINKFKPFFMLDNKNKLWFNAKIANSSKEEYKLSKSTISSCDCKNPSWSISFTSGDYNTTKEWVNAYNTTLYIKNFPVLYTPYFGFPTDDSRQSGLLRPTLGWSQKEGLHYAQPIYFAPKLNYDFEYIPQIRNQRGYGNALKYRYRDSLYSSLNLEMALFKEKSDYKEDMQLENDKHYGFNLNYKRDKLFSKNNNDGFIIDIVNMNDVDYINTKYDNDSMNYTNQFLESKVKYYNNNSFYSDIDFKFYNDISKDNNDYVMQSLPSINLHKYSNNLLFDKLLYSADINFERKTRNLGLGANITNISVPLSYNFTFFNDYLNLNLGEQFNYTNIQYTNNDQKYKDVNFLESNHILTLYTDLIKPYKEYLHTIKLDTFISYSDVIEENGDIYDVNTNNIADLNIFGIVKSNRNVSLGLNQSVYNKESLKEIVNHKLNQSYIYNQSSEVYEKGNLQNDFSFYYDYGKLSNRSFYNHKIKKIVDSATNLNFSNDDYFFNLYYLNTKDINTLNNQENINYEFGLSFNKYYTVSYKEEFNITMDSIKKKEYLFDIDKKCWGMNFKLTDSLVATNTVGNDNRALRQDVIYIEFNLKQLFKFNQVYKFDERNE